ncbi:MAG: valine--tRNA ligase [Lachnospiraceae bacterium]|nr:valine--tRNA ligase [Lachnospiraceae bacterium]
MKELSKTYDPASIEKRIYENWEQKGYFKASPNPKKKPYTIVMPPPNITGQLHLGHAIDNALQDILIRYRRMQGYEALWQPGTDHASIATEARVVEAMREEGLTKEMIGREGFLKRAWDWRDKYGKTIVRQLRKLGSSCDWDRERFTMDEGCSDAVRTVFVNLYNEGLIYRGNRMVNWCPFCHTSISDAEVEYEEKEGNFYHILYPVKETGEMLELATTRPETMLGDTAVAVNPEDPRYKHLHGCHVVLPLLNKEIPIICDEHADMEKGTGVVKITPAHDPNDFEVGNRHNLPRVRVFTYEGLMTGAEDKKAQDEYLLSGRAAEGEPEVLDCGKYAGMTTDEARAEVLRDLDQLGFLKKVEPLTHEVGTCYRCHHVIEPMISKQWFVRMKPLAEPAIKAVEEGRIRFVPDRFTRTYLNWMNNTRDWCISRQLWWGHQIPAWYCEDCGETIVSKEAPTVCPKCGKAHLSQDPDTLDTWFSSALWPFSTLGWPEETEDLKYFYPTDTLVTGYDIIGFWVSRMIFSGLAYTGEVPFRTVYIHGLVRDELGRKMSKSLGNGIDPLEVIEQYGADALRMMLLTGNAPGNDMRFSEKRMQACRNFANKIWNAARFIMMNLEKAEIPENMDPENLTLPDRWILSRVNRLSQEVTDNLDRFELGIALQKVSDFTWDEFCDWYIEMVKPRLYNSTDETKAAALWTLRTVLSQALKLLHPYIPFVTEEIYTALHPEEESIMISSWPVFDPALDFPEDEEKVEILKENVKAIRALRLDMNVAPSKKAQVYVVSQDAEVRGVFEETKHFFATLAQASEVFVAAEKDAAPEGSVSAVTSRNTVFLPLSDLVDIEKERERLKKEEERLQKELQRSRGMLGNEKFISRAPKEKIDEERAKLEKYEAMMAEVRERLSALR